MARLDLHENKVSDLFSKFYVIPEFQREFVWTDENVRQLLDDINEAMVSDTNRSGYFIGNIVLCEVDNDNDVSEVIDGQQRLITLYLIMCAVRDYFWERNENPPGLCEFYTKSPDNDRPRPRIVGTYESLKKELNDIALDTKETLAHRDDETDCAIEFAYEEIRHFFDQTFDNDPEKVKAFFTYVTSKVTLIKITLQDRPSALVVFERINARGVGLDPMDLLKNLLFMSVSNNEQAELDLLWRRIKVNLKKGKKDRRTLGFLRYFLMSTYDVEDKDLPLREGSLYTWMTKNRAQLKLDAEPFEFVERLVEASDRYSNFVRACNDNSEYNDHLYGLSCVSGSIRQHLILLLAGSQLRPDAFNELCKATESLLFAYSICKRPTRDLERDFARWAKDIRKCKTTNQLRVALGTESLSQDAIPDSGTQLPKYIDRIKSISKDFSTALFDLRLNRKSKSSERLVLYVLAKIDQYVEHESEGQVVWNLKEYFNKRKRTNVEHILPQRSSIGYSSNGNDDIYTELVSRLGNLTLLEQSINKSIQDSIFSEKLLEYEGSNYKLTKALATDIRVGKKTKRNAIVGRLRQYTAWDEDSILDRQNTLVAFALEAWSIPPTP